MSIQKITSVAARVECYNLQVQLRCLMFSVNQLRSGKKLLHLSGWQSLITRQVCILLKCVYFSMASKRLTTILVPSFARFNGLILKQIMKRIKCRSA